MNKGGIIAINKPSGWICTDILKNLQKILKKSYLYSEFETSQDYQHKRKKIKNSNYRKIKIGHGGTLDPLASGVLVIGIGKGTKELQKFLNCTKEYEATALFGYSTDTYDSYGKVLKRMPWSHLTRDKVEKALDNFKGNILQKPPLYSALHMKGKRLYEYAREGLELPEEIKSRSITVESFDIIKWTHDHEWEEPKNLSTLESSKSVLQEQISLNNDDLENNLSESDYNTQISNNLSNNNDIKEQPSSDNENPPIFKKAPAVKFRIVASSGTYIRSLIHDLGIFLGSAAHIVELVRSRQGNFRLNENTIDWLKFQNGNWENDFLNAINQKIT